MYFKCTSCKARLYGDPSPDSEIYELCPECGAMLEPVGELAEVVGYRSLTPVDPHVPRAEEARHGTVIRRFMEIQAGR
jgi:hypothetical protein